MICAQKQISETTRMLTFNKYREIQYFLTNCIFYFTNLIGVFKLDRSIQAHQGDIPCYTWVTNVSFAITLSLSLAIGYNLQPMYGNILMIWNGFIEITCLSMFLDLLRPRLPFTLGEKKVGGGKLTKSLLSAWKT